MGPRRPARTLALAAALLAPATFPHARALLSQDEALRLAFGDARVEREARFLTGAERGRAEELAGVGIPGELVTRYVATKDGALVGTAYFDTHLVRTLPETIVVVVDPSGRAARVEILAFGEPQDYLPRPKWLEQFRNRVLDGDLAVKRGIHGITGATLSARAVTEATRRVLALHRVLDERE